MCVALLFGCNCEYNYVNKTCALSITVILKTIPIQVSFIPKMYKKLSCCMAVHFEIIRIKNKKLGTFLILWIGILLNTELMYKRHLKSIVTNSIICFFICPVGGFIRQYTGSHLNLPCHVYLKSLRNVTFYYDVENSKTHKTVLWQILQYFFYSLSL